MRTARAKGLPERTVVLKHALRNSLITVTTIIGVQLGVLISGVVVTESIFVIPGFGRLTLDAISQRDYSLLQGVVLVSAVGYVVVNLTVDLLYSVLNPRIRVAECPEVHARSRHLPEQHQRIASRARFIADHHTDSNRRTFAQAMDRSQQSPSACEGTSRDITMSHRIPYGKKQADCNLFLSA